MHCHKRQYVIAIYHSDVVLWLVIVIYTMVWVGIDYESISQDDTMHESESTYHILQGSGFQTMTSYGNLSLPPQNLFIYITLLPVTSVCTHWHTIFAFSVR